MLRSGRKNTNTPVTSIAAVTNPKRIVPATLFFNFSVSPAPKYLAESLQWLWHVAILHLLADGSHQDDGESPTQSGTYGINDAIPYRGDSLSIGRIHQDALLHEERCNNDSTYKAR